MPPDKCWCDQKVVFMTRSQQSLPGDKPIWRGLRRSNQNCELTEIIIYKRLDFLILFAFLILRCRKN